jgi:dihydrofolate reductase
LARSLIEWGLIDVYRVYLHPVVLGQGDPFFAGPTPRLRLESSEPMGEDVVLLTYVPS